MKMLFAALALSVALGAPAAQAQDSTSGGPFGDFAVSIAPYALPIVVSVVAIVALTSSDGSN